MPRESAIPIDLPSLDDLFTTQAERDEVGCEKVGVIPLYMIDPFPDHPFRVDDDALRDMAESVSRFGVLVPALVRPKENGRYEMVSGHRRKRAAEMAGLEALPAVEISYLSEREQDDLLDAMGMEACTPSHAQAIRMRRLSEQGALSREAMASIMGERKPNQVEQFRIPREKIERFFKPGTSREAVEARIVKALELLERHERKRARER